jgi:hypothetical protein
MSKQFVLHAPDISGYIKRIKEAHITAPFVSKSAILKTFPNGIN